MAGRDAWRGFTGAAWRSTVDVAGFIRHNYTPYLGDGRFLAGATPRTTKLWVGLADAFAQERERGVWDVDVRCPSGITAHPPGYIDREHELIVGLQTDAPLRRAVRPACPTCTAGVASSATTAASRSTAWTA